MTNLPHSSSHAGRITQRHGLFGPGVRLFANISFPAKSAFVSLAFMLPVALLTWSTWQVANANIEFSSKEIRGVDYTRQIMPLLDAAQNRRRAASANAPDMPQAQERVQKALSQLEATHRELGDDLGLQQQFQDVKSLAGPLVSEPVKSTTLATFNAHTDFIKATFELLNNATDNSNLTLDPDLDTYYLMHSGLFAQPDLVEVMGQMRGLGNAVLRNGTMTPAQRDVMSRALGLAEGHALTMSKDIARAVAFDASVKQAVNDQMAREQSKAFLDMVKAGFFGDSLSGDPANFVKTANEAIATVYALNTQTLNELERRLQTRVSALQSKLWLQLGVSLAGIALAIYLLVAFYRLMRGSLDMLSTNLEELSKGNLSIEPSSTGKDEMVALVRTIANTVQSLRSVVKQVRSGAAEIEVASSEVAAASGDLSRRTDETAVQLQKTASAMNQIGSTVRQTADMANGASKLVTQNAEVAGQGGKVVNKVIDTMGASRALRTGSPTSSAPSTGSPSRPTSWRSTPRSKRRERARPVADLRWWRPRCACWPNDRLMPRTKSKP